MVAARSTEMTNPMLLDGIKFNLNGNKDAAKVAKDMNGQVNNLLKYTQ